MLFRMLPCGIVLVLSRFQVMTKCNPGMMRGLLVIARFVVLGGLAMMFDCGFIVLRCFFAMLVNLVLPAARRATVQQRDRDMCAPDPCCHNDVSRREALIDVSNYMDDVEMPSFACQARCGNCVIARSKASMAR